MKHIAIAGLGVVGGGVAEILLKNAALLEKNAGEKIVLKAIYTQEGRSVCAVLCLRFFCHRAGPRN